MDSIRLQNFRSIKDSGDIKINKINVLLGKNSSGKSSFLRVFPLFNASIKHELKGPLLWFDEEYDYGSFQNTLYRGAEEDDKHIHFTFKWKVLPEDAPSYLKNTHDVEVEMVIGDEQEKTILSELIIKTNETKVRFVSQQGDILKPLVYLNSKRIAFKEFNWRYEVKGILPGVSMRISDTPLMINILKIQEKLKAKLNIKEPSILDMFGIESLSENSIAKKIGELTNIGSENKKFIADLRAMINMAIINDLYRYCDAYITANFDQSYYITPLRFSTARFMRDSDFSVDRIDASGKNAINYIASLDKNKLNKLNVFLGRTLKAQVKTSGTSNKELVIYDKDDNEYNIVDVGYGYTQLLPIALMLWNIATKKNNSQKIAIIEQPEVHLHPSMQKLLAHLFIEAIKLAKSNQINLRLIVETHSVYFVNMLGRYVYNKEQHFVTDEQDMHEVSADDISIYLFEKYENITNITQTSYDENGRIKQWPIGFLD